MDFIRTVPSLQDAQLTSQISSLSFENTMIILFNTILSISVAWSKGHISLTEVFGRSNYCYGITDAVARLQSGKKKIIREK